MHYDVIIIGAGPGGIFTAYEMLQQKKEIKIAVFEAGHSLDRRRCPIDGEQVKSCIKCKSCSIMSGFRTENTISPMILAELCMNISARQRQLS